VTTTCPDCGAEYGVGCWYACPHEPIHAGRGADVTWPGGKTFENLGHDPVTFYSPAEKYQYLKTHGIAEFIRHQPVPGTDKSPHTTSWASGFSPEYLAGVSEMLARVGKSSSTSESPSYVKEFSVTITDVVERVRGSLT
jgi:hypothetical protein